ncbi:MAG: hypothetical protein L6R35_005261, partial [Caloplaca aegaea]
PLDMATTNTEPHTPCEECDQYGTPCPQCEFNQLVARQSHSSSSQTARTEPDGETIGRAEAAREEKLQQFFAAHETSRASKEQLEAVFDLGLDEEEQEKLLDLIENPRMLYPLEGQTVLEKAVDLVVGGRRQRMLNRAAMARGIVWWSFLFHVWLAAKAQVTGFTPLDAFTRFRVLGSCPKTYLSRVVDQQFTSFVCNTGQRTAECVCNTQAPDTSRRYEIGSPYPTSSTTAVLSMGTLLVQPVSSTTGPASNPAIPTAASPGNNNSSVDPPVERRDSSGLSAGDIAGIVVAVVVFIGTIISTIFLERRRRAAVATSHYSWLNKADHMYFILVAKAAKPFGGHSTPPNDPLKQQPQGDEMKRLETRETPLALESPDPK